MLWPSAHALPLRTPLTLCPTVKKMRAPRGKVAHTRDPFRIVIAALIRGDSETASDRADSAPESAHISGCTCRFLIAPTLNEILENLPLVT